MLFAFFVLLQLTMLSDVIVANIFFYVASAKYVFRKKIKQNKPCDMIVENIYILHCAGQMCLYKK